MMKKWAKTLTDTLPKKRGQVSIWKDVLQHMSAGKCKVTPQWDTTILLLEWPKSRRLTPPNAEKAVDQQELSVHY